MTTNQNRGETVKLIAVIDKAIDPNVYGHSIATVDYEPFADHLTADDARRLVACWNACAGAKTEWLEGVGQPYKELREINEKYRSRVTSLEAVCNEIKDILGKAICHDHGMAAETLAWLVRDYYERLKALSPSGPQEA